MASPFSIFRRNQKLLMAVACLLAIIAFVFLPLLGDNWGLRQRGAANLPVVVSKYGDLLEADLHARRQEHRRVLGALAEIRQAAGEYPQWAQQRAEAEFGDNTERRVVDNWLLARYAQQLGIVVSDKAINAFLRQWSRDVVKPAEFQAAFKRAGLSELQFFHLMRDELLAREVRLMFDVSLAGITPAERWEYFTRVKQMATIEAAPVAVANYVARVGEPSDEELKTLFETHQEDYPLPESPEPGFREPHKIALQWFKADQEKFAASVTEAQIKERYEKNKDLYDQVEKKSDKKSEKKPAAAKPGLTEATKTRIRREIADEKIMKIFEKLHDQMEQYRSQWSKYEVAMIQERSKKEELKGKTPLPPAPSKLDFEKLAKENGLSTGQAPLAPQWETLSSPIGRSLVNGRDPVYHYAFLSLAKFRPAISIGLTGDFYLLWKTEETKDRIPNFDDPGVRERVLKAWKMIQARPLAMKAAESLAADARKAKEPLRRAFAGRPDLHVVLPPPFSWITFGNVPLGSAPNAARISAVTDVDFAGDEFMRTVFRLEPGQTGVALNAPKTVAYVIRLTGLSPSQKVLWSEFEVDDFSKYAPAAAEDQRQIARAWLNEIKASANMEWKRKPDRMMESGPREDE
jgi:hypothetical protein